MATYPKMLNFSRKSYRKLGAIKPIGLVWIIVGNLSYGRACAGLCRKGNVRLGRDSLLSLDLELIGKLRGTTTLGGFYLILAYCKVGNLTCTVH